MEKQRRQRDRKIQRDRDIEREIGGQRERFNEGISASQTILSRPVYFQGKRFHLQIYTQKDVPQKNFQVHAWSCILCVSLFGVNATDKYLVWTITATMTEQKRCYRKVLRNLERPSGFVLESNKSARDVWTAAQQERGQAWKIQVNSRQTDILQTLSPLKSHTK